MAFNPNSWRRGPVLTRLLFRVIRKRLGSVEVGSTLGFAVTLFVRSMCAKRLSGRTLSTAIESCRIPRSSVPAAPRVDSTGKTGD